MRRWLLDLHLYVGLACLPYVVLFGVSSLLLNHDVRREVRRHWEEAVTPPLGGDDLAQARAVRDALGLRGAVLEHTLARAADGALRFELHAPGHVYEIALDAGGLARVDVRDGGAIGVVRELHGRGGLEASAWGPSWAVYTEVTTFGFLFSLATGLWLLWPRRAERWLALGTAALGLAAVLLLAGRLW